MNNSHLFGQICYDNLIVYIEFIQILLFYKVFFDHKLSAIINYKSRVIVKALWLIECTCCIKYGNSHNYAPKQENQQLCPKARKTVNTHNHSLAFLRFHIQGLACAPCYCANLTDAYECHSIKEPVT